MATLKIEFNTDNAAFDDDYRFEASRILGVLANDLGAGLLDITMDECPIYDINGNRIGKVSHTGDSQ